MCIYICILAKIHHTHCLDFPFLSLILDAYLQLFNFIMQVSEEEKSDCGIV